MIYIAVTIYIYVSYECLNIDLAITGIHSLWLAVYKNIIYFVLKLKKCIILSVRGKN